MLLEPRLLGGRRVFSRGDFRTVDQLDEGHRGVVANAEAHLQDADVAARTRVVARADFGEQLLDDFAVTQAGECQALVGQGVALAQGDDRLDDFAQFLLPTP